MIQRALPQLSQPLKNKPEFDAIRVQGAKKLEALNYSKDNTLLPSEVYAGIITLKAPDKTDGKAKYTITIPFAGETHSFQVIQTKLESYSASAI
jgi:hypothetical protein